MTASMAESFNDGELCIDVVDPSNGDIGIMVALASPELGGLGVVCAQVVVGY